MKTLVDRLRKETNETIERAWKFGAREAHQWLRCARFGHLRQIGEGDLTFDKPADDVMRFLNYHYPGWYFKTEQDEYDEYLAEQHSDVETYRRGFNQGFVDVVKEVWNEIKPAI